MNNFESTQLIYLLTSVANNDGWTLKCLILFVRQTESQILKKRKILLIEEKCRK